MFYKYIYIYQQTGGGGKVIQSRQETKLGWRHTITNIKDSKLFAQLSSGVNAGKITNQTNRSLIYTEIGQNSHHERT